MPSWPRLCGHWPAEQLTPGRPLSAAQTTRPAIVNYTRPHRLSSRRLEAPEAAPACPDRRGGIGLKRLRQQLVVDVPEVGGGFEIAVVEVGEAGFVAEEAALDRCPGDEHRASGAVIG